MTIQKNLPQNASPPMSCQAKTQVTMRIRRCGFWSQVKLLINNNALCIVQRATARSKTGIFCDYGVAEAPPGFQAGWSDCM
jgi:hypothetical protein